MRCYCLAPKNLRQSMMRENSYGVRKRLEFVAAIATPAECAHILEIGCGTGAMLSHPLACRFEEKHFVAIDTDAASIDFAQSNYARPNLQFGDPSLLETENLFDLVIASEVIEHVEDPDEFLVAQKGRLAPGGRIVLTLPNGNGPCELSVGLEALLRLCGLYRLLRVPYRMMGLGQSRPVPANSETPGAGFHERDSLAISPHINFFSGRQIRRLIARAGLNVELYRPRTLFCGFGFSNLMRSRRLVAWNAKLADVLPGIFASDWMFILVPGRVRAAKCYHRGPITRLRRRLNEKRWRAS
jgi:SAM-dependent methyltransferase